jgi:hypothetical protein
MTRRSKREISRAVDGLEEAEEKYPEASLNTIMMAELMDECEDVEGEPDLIRCHGEIHRVSEDTYAALRADHDANPNDYAEADS